MFWSGECDQIAIDNPKLQLQIQTKKFPGRSWSAVTEVALILKNSPGVISPNDYVFRLDNAGSYSSTTALPISSGVSAIVPHNGNRGAKVTFDDGSIMLFRVGTRNDINIEVTGKCSTFKDSEGMMGSWKYGGVRYGGNDSSGANPPGSFFSTLGGYAGTGHRSLPLAMSWQIPLQDNKLTTPNNTRCHYRRRRRGRKLDEAFEIKPDNNTATGCERTCNDIDNPVLKEACEQDLALTGDPTWACAPNYVSPLIVEPTEPPCYDSPFEHSFSTRRDEEISKQKFCHELKGRRCNRLQGAKELCPQTCGACRLCADPPKEVEFKLTHGVGGGQMRNCAWVAEDTATRCSKVRNICRKTCGVCT